MNARFTCLATLSETRSFRPLWKPAFIDRIVSEDRCHLNGIAMDQGQPRYVTAVSQSNTIDGWRDRRAEGGILIDVESGTCVEWLRIDGATSELYDVGVLAGVATPMALGFSTSDIANPVTSESLATI